MTERLEDRLRDALDLLTADPPLTGAAGPLRRRRRTPRRLPALVAMAALIAIGVVLVDNAADRPDDALHQVTGPVTTTGPALPAPAAPPAPTTRRAIYPDAPTVSQAPTARASVVFGNGKDDRWTWFVVDGADGSVRVAADLLPARSFEVGGAALSPDGRRLAYSIVSRRDAQGPPVTPQVVVVDITTGSETRFAANGRIGPGAWSGDGRRLAWLEDGRTLVLADADGRPAGRASVGAGRTTVRWSPAGDQLVAAGCPGGPPPAMSCMPSIVNAATMAVRAHPMPMSGGVVWTPDGRSLVDLRRSDVILVAADGSGVRQVPVVESVYPVQDPFSPDGNLILVRPERSGAPISYAGAATLEGRVRAEVSDEQQVPEVLGWKGNDALLVAREEPGAIVVYAAPLDGSPRRRLLSVAIRDEDFGGASLVVAGWFTRA
jgi:Tol biopolymer transport system component